MIQEISKVGNKWWRIDFHCHTPASEDYGKGSQQKDLKKITPEEYLMYYMKTEIDGIVITDHNTGAWIDKLKNAYEKMKVNKGDWFRESVIFPGVELTVNGNFHLLAVLPEDKTTSDLDGLLGAVHYKGTKGESDACTESSFVEVVDEIVDMDGIAIPAHCDDIKGVFTESNGNTLKQIIEKDTIYAAEILSDSSERPQLYIDSKANWCRVIGSDAHHPMGTDGNKFHGSHFTWVKMATLCFKELELSLKDGEMSVKCSSDLTNSPNEFKHCVLERLTIENAMYFGRGQSFSIQFSPWLNTIIGGRGTGKSTIVEFIRTASNRINELPNTLTSDFSKYWESRKGKIGNGLMLDETTLKLEFVKDEQYFQVVWKKESEQSELYIKKIDDYELTDGDVVNRLPLRIYSQKQIFELSRNPEALMNIINEAQEILYDDWKEEYDILISKFLALGAKKRELQVSLKNQTEVKGELEDIDNKIKILNKMDQEGILNSYAEGRKRINVLENIKKFLVSRIDDLEKFLSGYVDREKPQQEIDDVEIESIWKIFINIDDANVKELERVLSNYRESLEHIEQVIADSDILKNYNMVKDEYEKIQNELRSVGISEGEEYKEIIKRRESLEEKLKLEKERSKEVSKIEKEQKEILEKVKEKRDEMTDKRENFINNILQDNKYVKMKIVKYGNYKLFLSYIRSLLGKEKGFDKILGSVEEDGLLIQKIENAESIICGIDIVKDDITKIYNGVDVENYDKKFANLIRNQDSDFIDKIRVWYPDDSLEVSYSTGKSKFLPIDNASPGQRTATLLAFILSYGNEPLILDQPEDDLDNSLISELIVNNIRDEKIKRQIIIVTHNANIVVNGDSDNVAVLHVAGGQTQIEDQSGLQCINIRKQICNILEGGRDAFRKRYKRINISGI